MRTKLVRVDADSPERCGGVGRNGGQQCPYGRVPNTPYCALHGGASTARAMAKKAFKLYKISKYRQRLDELSDDQDAASRHLEELAICRMTIEALVNEGNQVDLVRNAPKLTILLKEARELMAADRKLMAMNGEVIGRAVLGRLCSAIATVVQDFVPADRLAECTDRLAAVLAAAVEEAQS